MASFDKEGEILKEIYVDHAATSPTHPDVVEAMLPFLYGNFGNPSSIHQFGRKTRQEIDEARLFLAQTIGCNENEIIFTSSGTEADNLAVIGYANANKNNGKHIITTKIEHHALLHSCERLEKNQFDVSYLSVDETGKINLEELQSLVRDDTILVSIMFGNNEVGTIQPIREIGSFLKQKNIAFHTDAVQAYGIEHIDVKEMNIDLLSVSAHKINGPKGVGFLYVSNGKRVEPYMIGGDQERKRRAGTENIAGIIGLKQAAKIAFDTINERRKRYVSFREKLLKILDESKVEYKVNGDKESYLPHIINISFKGVSVESLLINLDLVGIAASSGSACTAGSLEPSHVLVAMFPEDRERVLSSVRFSFGLGNSLEEVEELSNKIVQIIQRIKKT